MSNSSVLLSISMLISGREEMRKSLDSLLYFKNAFPTEVILVDTGCSPEQRTLAEKYADKIIDFTWCNDFAAARNAGLREAHGEWFMYLDDDEWFENPKEIIHFFTSGEYRKYNCASYVVRNYENFEGTMYEDSYPSRMVKLEARTKFIGKIHEYLDPFEMPKKTFSDYVHHYGYVYKDEASKIEHSKRNLAPLREMVRDYPGEPRWICQLAQEYYAIKDYEATLDTCIKGLEEWRKRKEQLTYAPAHVGALYCYILFSLECLKKYEEEEKWLEKALADPVTKYKFVKPTVAFYYQAATRLYSILRRYDLCSEYLGRYIDYAGQLRNDRTAIEAGATTIASAVFQEQLLYGAIMMGMESAIRMQRHTLAEEAFFMMDWTDHRLLHQNKYEKRMVDACCSVPYHSLWVKIFQTLVAREDGVKEMYVVFLETEIAYKEQEEIEKLSRLYRLVAEIDFEHRYILSCRILWTERNPELEADERKQQLLALFTELIEKYADELFEVKSEIWDVAQRMDIPIEPSLLKIDYKKWKHALEQWSGKATSEELNMWNTRISTWQTTENIHYDLFHVKYAEGCLRVYQESQTALEETERRLWEYADAVIAMYKPYYKEFVFTEAIEVLPEEAQLALRLKHLQEYRQQGNDKEALRQIKDCLTICPSMEAVVSKYAASLRDEIQKQIQNQNSEKAELEKLVASLKSVTKLRLQRGEWQAAEEILHQIQACMPEDGEVKVLLEQTAEMSGR